MKDSQIYLNTFKYREAWSNIEHTYKNIYTVVKLHQAGDGHGVWWIVKELDHWQHV